MRKNILRPFDHVPYQALISKKFRISQPMLSQVLHGKRNFSYSKCQKIARMMQKRGINMTACKFMELTPKQKLYHFKLVIDNKMNYEDDASTVHSQ